MITIYKYDDLGHVNHGWLNARHHFSFGSYFNKKRLNFGKLKVINDDIIQAGSGFATHPHNNMEIITYVRSGAISHKDSKGNEGKTKAGDVQVMSAGTGILHSEHNHEKEDTNLYQIWIEPNQRNVEPRWDAKEFPKESVKDGLNLLVSGDNDAPLFIYQDARIYAGRLDANTSIEHSIKHQAYILVSYGDVMINDQRLEKGDGAEITDLSTITITAQSDCELLLIDAPR